MRRDEIQCSCNALGAVERAWVIGEVAVVECMVGKGGDGWVHAKFGVEKYWGDARQDQSLKEAQLCLFPEFAQIPGREGAELGLVTEWRSLLESGILKMR